jgi:hypothetical protein
MACMEAPDSPTADRRATWSGETFEVGAAGAGVGELPCPSQQQQLTAWLHVLCAWEEVNSPSATQGATTRRHAAAVNAINFPTWPR